MGTGIHPCSSLANRTFIPLAWMPVYPRFDAYRLRCEVAAACVVTSGHSVIPFRRVRRVRCAYMCARMFKRARKRARAGHRGRVLRALGSARVLPGRGL